VGHRGPDIPERLPVARFYRPSLPLDATNLEVKMVGTLPPRRFSSNRRHNHLSLTPCPDDDFPDLLYGNVRSDLRNRRDR
jgi:hypothetical protein